MPKQRSRNIWFTILSPFILLTFALSLAGLGGQYHLYLEQASHFKVQYLGLALLLLPLTVLSRCRWLVVLAGVTVGLNAIFVLPWFIPVSKPPDTSQGLAIAVANVLSQNQQYPALLEWVNKTQPDLIVLQEFSPAWQRALESWDDTFPYQILQPRLDNFGMALYSRIPLGKSQVHTFATDDIPWIEAEIPWADQTLNLFAVHPVPPISSAMLAGRNTQLMTLARRVQEQVNTTSPLTVLLGDFNISPWSPVYGTLLHTAQLKNACQGFGIQPTWSRDSLLAIPIDHILVSPAIAISECRTGSDIGSDHVPLRAILHPPLASEGAL